MIVNLLSQKLELPSEGIPTKIEGPLKPGTFGGKLMLADVLYRAIPFVFAFAGIGLLLMLLASGFSYLTGAGDAKKLEQARQKLTYALVGFFVIFVAYWLVQIAGVIFGIPEFGTIFK